MKNRRKALIGALVVTALITAALIGAYYIYQRKYYMLKYEDIIAERSKEYDLDPHFVAAVIHTESKFEKDAVSHKGASGLMQIMPDVGEWVAKKTGVEDYRHEMLFEPDMNVRFGCWMLRYLINRYDGDELLALAAYNAGSGNVDKWLGNPKYSVDGETLDEIPYNETKNFVLRVQNAYERYQALYDIS